MMTVQASICTGGPATHLYLVYILCRSYTNKSDFAGPPWCFSCTLRIAGRRDGKRVLVVLSTVHSSGTQILLVRAVIGRIVPGQSSVPLNTPETTCRLSICPLSCSVRLFSHRINRYNKTQLSVVPSYTLANLILTIPSIVKYWYS